MTDGDPPSPGQTVGATVEEPRVGIGWRAAHVLALSSLAVTEPVLSVLGQNPTFFVAHGSGPGQVLLVAVLAAAVVPAILIPLELVVGRLRPAWAWPLHLVIVGALVALVAAGVVDDLIGTVLDDLPLVSGPLTVLVAGGAGYGVVQAYRHRPMLRSMLSALAIAPLGFLAFFAFATPAYELLFPSTVAAADVSLGDDLPPIVMVVFDELPLASVLDADATTIDADRFPNLARLAGDGVWYPNATSVAGYTHEAVPAILTGERVHDENLPPTPSGHPDSLFTFLANDYSITSHEELTGLCTPSLCEESTGLEETSGFRVLLEDLGIVAGHVALPAVLEGWLPTINDTWANFGQDPVALDQEADRLAEDRADFVEALGEFDRVGEFRAAVADIEATPEPHLTFIHSVFPHVPWSRHADGSVYPDPGNPGLDDNVWSSAAAADLALQRHLLQAQFADELLGELIARLEAEDLYDDALVVFTADHGASFTPGTHRRLPAEDSVAGLMPVPMVVKPPAADPVADHTDDRIAETIDLVPTIADFLGAPLPWEADGVSLVGPEPETHERGIYARGETVSTDEDPVDLTPVVDHIWERFGDGVGDGLQLYGLGPDGDRIGRRVRARDRGGEDGEACWSPADPVEGTRAWAGGEVDTDLDGDLDLAVVVEDRVAATTTTYAEDGRDHAVFALGDPALWPEHGSVSLWRITEDAWLEVPLC